MPEKFPTTLVVGLVVAIAIGAAAYFWLGVEDGVTDSLQTTGSGNVPADSMTASAEDIDTTMILVQLNELQGFEINTDIYSSEQFLSLRDYSVTISEQPIGRENPFIRSSFQEGSTISPNTDSVSQQTLDIFEIDSDDSEPEEEESAEPATSTDEATSSPETDASGDEN